MLELGTGTGLLGIYCYLKMKQLGQQNIRMTLTDLEMESLDITKRNLALNSIANSSVDV